MAGTWKKVLKEMTSSNDNDLVLAKLALKGGKKIVGAGAYAAQKLKDKKSGANEPREGSYEIEETAPAEASAVEMPVTEPVPSETPAEEAAQEPIMAETEIDTPEEMPVSSADTAPVSPGSFTLEGLKFTVQCPKCGSSSSGDVCQNCGADLKGYTAEKIVIKNA